MEGILFKFLSSIGISYTILSIIYSIQYRQRKRRYQFNNDNQLFSRIKTAYTQRKYKIHKLFYIQYNGTILVYIFTMSLLPWIDNLTNFKFSWLIVTFIGIVLIIGIGNIMTNFTFGDRVSRSLQYIMNICNLLVYVLTLTTMFDQTQHNLRLLLITTVIIIYFSFVFVRSVILHFSNFLFLLVNVVFFILLNLSSIGLIFGIVFLTNNNIFGLYLAEEYTILNSNITNDRHLYYYIFFIIYKGLTPFYNYSKISLDLNLFDTYGFIVMTPFIEFLIGIVFSICLVSFIISSLVTRTINPFGSDSKKDVPSDKPANQSQPYH